MADESFINRKDLEDVTQKVAIQNSKDIAKPLIDQQKNNDLKELERSIEQKAMFQDITDALENISDALLNGLKGLIPKEGSGFGFLAGALGLLSTLFLDIVQFFKILWGKLKKSKLGRLFSGLITNIKNGIKKIGLKIKNSKIGQAVANMFSTLKAKFQSITKTIKNSKVAKGVSNLFNNVKNSKLVGFISNIFNKIKNSKILTSIRSLLSGIFSGKGGFFSKLANIFKRIKDFVTKGPFKFVTRFVGGIGRILGKLFLPLTIILGIVDFVKGFMRGYSEGGIIEGIKQGIMDVFDGLIGSLLRIFSWIPAKIAELLGLDNYSKEIGKFTETLIQSVKDIFGGLVDVIVGVITFDKAKIKKGFGKIWEGIVNFAEGWFDTLAAFFQDVFDVDIKAFFKPVGDAFNDMFDWFGDLADKLGDIFTMQTLKDIGDSLMDAAINMIPSENIRNWIKDDEEDASTSLNLSPRQLRALQDIGGGIPSGSPLPGGGTGGGIRVANNNPTVINNTINAPSNNGIAAMQRAFAMG